MLLKFAVYCLDTFWPKLSVQIAILNIFLIFNVGGAAEIDSFTPRYQNFPEGLVAVDREVNRRISIAVDKANKISKCNILILETLLATQLLSPFYGQIEEYANVSPVVPHLHVTFEKSIYRNLPPFNSFLMTLGESLFGFGHVIRENTWLIGTDKLGHFFDEGHTFYKKIDDDGGNLMDVLSLSMATEDGIFGKALGGVKSYSDLAANYGGMIFWSQMLKSKFINDVPYLTCQNGQWIKMRPFAFKEYVTAAWDEAINCSEFREGDFAKTIYETIEQFKEDENHRFRCPVDPEQCSRLRVLYGKVSKMVLSPKCI